MYRTLFGKLRLRTVRLFHCVCQPAPAWNFSPLAQLLSKRTAPELLSLESKIASLISYGLTVDLLQEVLPIGQEINAATIRHNMHTVAQRIEDELKEERIVFIGGFEQDWGQPLRPDLLLKVGLDGGYVHSCTKRSRKHGWFEVIAGKECYC